MLASMRERERGGLGDKQAASRRDRCCKRHQVLHTDIITSSSIRHPPNLEACARADKLGAVAGGAGDGLGFRV